MMNLFVLRERIKRFYQKTSVYLNLLIKFAAALVVFTLMTRQLGYNAKLNSLFITLILSVICAVTPSQVFVLLAAAMMVGQVYAASKVAAVFIAVILIIIYCLFARFTPDFGYVVLAVPVLFFLKIPYCVPILLGMVSAPLSIVPLCCGVGIYYLIGVIKQIASVSSGTSIEDILTVFRVVMSTWFENRDMMFAMLIFSAVLLVTYLIRKQDFDYSFETAIVVGAAVNILGFLIGNIEFDIQVTLLPIFLGTLASALLAYLVWFFRLTLDHTAIEKVQFEDDDYYYYVKAVPKIKVTTPKKNIKKINEKRETVMEENER